MSQFKRGFTKMVVTELVACKTRVTARRASTVFVSELTCPSYSYPALQAFKGKGKGIRAPDLAEGRGRRGTPASKPLFSPSRLLIKKITKITQLLTRCFSFVFLKQEI